MFTLALFATVAFIIYGFLTTLSIMVVAGQLVTLMKAFTQAARGTENPS